MPRADARQRDARGESVIRTIASLTGLSTTGASDSERIGRRGRMAERGESRSTARSAGDHDVAAAASAARREADAHQRNACVMLSAVRGVQPQTAGVGRLGCIVAGVVNPVVNVAALPMRLFVRDRVAKGEHGRRERQRAWRPMTLVRAGPQARRGAPATRALIQQCVRLEESGRAPARRRRRARRCERQRARRPAKPEGPSIARPERGAKRQRCRR